jgi:glyoxalase family protein
MRLVKRSVNQDDVSAYHLFYADGAGRPGTDLTFFDWAMPRERRGTHAITRTCLRVDGAASAPSGGRSGCAEHGVAAGEVAERDGRRRSTSRTRRDSAWRWWTTGAPGTPRSRGRTAPSPRSTSCVAWGRSP